MGANGNPKYWFKATATTPAYLPISFEGGLYAETFKGALDAVNARSRYWNITRLNMVHIYEMDENGAIGEEPAVSVNHALNSTSYSAGGYRATRPVIAIAPIPKEPTILDEYNDASWIYKIDLPDPFPVVRHMEETSKCIKDI